MTSTRRKFWVATISIAAFFSIFPLSQSFTIQAALAPILGPWCLHLGSEVSNGWGYQSGTLVLAQFLSALLPIAAVLQFFPRPSTETRGIRILIWSICWILWCGSSWIMILSTLG